MTNHPLHTLRLMTGLALAWVLCAALVVTTTAPPASSTPRRFDDVGSGEYYSQAVAWLAAEEITTGTSPTTFSPHDIVTRAQMATFLARYSQAQPADAASPFADIDEGTYYHDAVGWLAAQGITTGTSPTTFSPHDIVTRAQMATFLWRFAGEPRASSPAFADVPAGSYYHDAVGWLAAQGITTGTSPTTFSPHDIVTRAQMAAFLWRFAGEPPTGRPGADRLYHMALQRFTATSERTHVDRPDEHEGPMVKFLYVVPSFATDRERDIDGEIASYVYHANEWLASQNGGFGVRVDTFEGALDVPYVEIETTPEEWSSWFAESLAPAAERLISQGWPISRYPEGNGEDLYYVVWEATAGTYVKTSQSGGQCRPVIDGTNAAYRMVGFAVATPDDEPCRLDFGRFPFDGTSDEQRAFLSTSRIIGFVDHNMQMMRGLPDCPWIESPSDGELYTVPGTDIVEIRGGFIRDLLEFQDPIAMRMRDARGGTTPELDVRHNTYFHTTTGKLARTSCNSDAGRHPMWSDIPFYAESPTVPRRSVLDRPDDVEGRQLHAVYVKAAGAPDRALDTGLEIAAALRDFDAWMRSETGGTGIRLDTFDGHLDITYLPLPMSMEEYVESGDCLGDRCPSDIDFEQLLIEAGYHDPTKTYAFFYDGGISPNRLCGGARTNSRSLLINLDDFTERSCTLPWRAEPLDEFALGHLVGHELLHTLGAVCLAAPSADGGFHSTDPSDFMNAGASGPGQRLDADRDSYWGPGAPAGCDVSTDGIFTTEANRMPSDGTTLDSVPIGVNTMQPSARTWWLGQTTVTTETASAIAASDNQNHSHSHDFGPRQNTAGRDG